MKTILLSSLLLFITNSVTSQDAKIFQSEKLLTKWETPQTLLTPESVCYDPATGVLYVANINGKPTEKDGNGFISVLSIDGKITELRWVTGLNAPKGMGIFNGKLYVTDIDRVAVINIKSKTIEKFYEFPEAKFLNDIAIDIYGTVYISDMMSTRIYRISEDKAEVWLDNKVLTSPNGLFVENDELIVGCEKIVLANIKNKKILTWLEDTGGIDGLEAVGDGRYIFSDWSGSVYLVGSDKKIEKILDTTPAGINAADIEFIPEMQLLLVPTFGDNRIVAYELK
jgi:sugar lactone lactonase YvrE